MRSKYVAGDVREEPRRVVHMSTYYADTVVVVLVLVLLTPTSLLDLKEGLFSLPLILNY